MSPPPPSSSSSDHLPLFVLSSHCFFLLLIWSSSASATPFHQMEPFNRLFLRPGRVVHQHPLFPVPRPVEASREVRWNVWAEQMCTGPGQPQQCNAHRPQFRCECHSEAEVAAAAIRHRHFVSLSPFPSCLAALPPADRPDEQLLTIGIAFPVVEQFLEDPEGVFLEDLEIFTFIPRESVLIYRRGCSADGTAYEFQIGILESKCGRVARAENGQLRLRTLSPRIFLANPFFMQENALKVAYVRKAAVADYMRESKRAFKGRGGGSSRIGLEEN